MLEIGTQQRRSLYNLRQSSRPVFIPRDLRLEVSGRIAADGSEIEAVDDGEVATRSPSCRRPRSTSVAVAGLFSYLNPDQEALLEELVRELAPDLYVVRSSSASREPREYPRFATVAVNAALAPRIEPYIRRLLAELEAAEPDCSLFIMQSIRRDRDRRAIGRRARPPADPLRPRGRRDRGAHFADKCGFDNCVTFDLGGTSTDIGVVRDGAPRTGFQMELPNGVPVQPPAHRGRDDRRRRRQHRLDRPGWRPQRRSPQRRCRTRARLLRTRRHRADGHRRAPPLGRLSTGGLIGGRLPLDAGLAAAALGSSAKDPTSTSTAPPSACLRCSRRTWSARSAARRPATARTCASS